MITPTTLDTVYTTRPARLMYFVAWEYYGGGQLHWISQGEDADMYYEVQQSLDGRRWTSLGSMTNHSSYTPRYDYVFMDANIGRYRASRVYYRLCLVGLGQLKTYSPVRCIRLQEDTAAK